MGIATAGGTLNRPLLICRFAIFESRVCRGTPSFRAAPEGPEMRPLDSASAASITSRSRSASVATSGEPGIVIRDDARVSHESPIEKVSPSLRMTARSITFCSSRMFPGQSYAASLSQTTILKPTRPKTTLTAQTTPQHHLLTKKENRTSTKKTYPAYHLSSHTRRI